MADNAQGGTPEESDGERDDSLLPIVLDTSEDSTINIPIFTDQFLQHNKVRAFLKRYIVLQRNY